MFRTVNILVLIALFLFSGLKGKEPDSLGGKNNNLLVLPVLFFTPETKWAGGAAVNYFFRTGRNTAGSRPSTVMPSFIYTQKKQIMAEGFFDIYGQNQAWHMLGYVAYKKFPDLFYGIGHDTPGSSEEKYTPRTTQIRLNLLKRFFPGLNIGIQYEYEHHTLLKVEPGGLLAGRSITGSSGGSSSGAGLLVNYDTRDNIFYPVSGIYFQWAMALFHRLLGSDYGFRYYSLDFRRYLSCSSSGVLALHFYTRLMNGNPPFQMLSGLGGRIDGYNIMRGYYEGRYRDKQLLALQLEYRLWPLWQELGLVTFAGWGDVSDKIKNFELQSFKYFLGVGIRFRINSREKLNIRVDYAMGPGTGGWYITVGEAF